MKYQIKLLAVAALPLLFVACNKGKSGRVATAYQPEQPAAPANPRFQKIDAANSGIHFKNEIKETQELNLLTDYYIYNGGGVGVIDVNNDGQQDLYFTGTLSGCKLYLNKGGLKFEDITQSAGVEALEGQKTGVTIADVNADGWQDIYVCRTALKPGDISRNLLFINNKNNTFTENARAFGLADNSPSNLANFFDCDNDGDLDCYVINHSLDYLNVNVARVKDVGNGRIERISEPQAPYESNRLYLNNGDNTFTDITKKAGIYNHAFSLSVTVSDLNHDGFKDVMVGNDYIDPDFLYFNNPAQPGSFIDRVHSTFRHHSNHTMGVDFGDINNDGLSDIMAVDMLAEPAKRRQELMNTMSIDRQTTIIKSGYGRQQMRNMLQLNNGNGSYSDIGCLAGVYQTDWSWAPLIQDYDNDGWRDIFVANGFKRDITNLDYFNFTVDSVTNHGSIEAKNIPNILQVLDLLPSTPIQNYCYRNRGDLSFENVSTAWGFHDLNFSNGAAYSDLDNDGDLDMIVNLLDQEALVYQNKTVENKEGNWLQIKPVGGPANPFAIGAVARVTVGENVYLDELTPTRGFFSSVEPIFHYGLGKADHADKVEIEFPGGKLVTLQNVKVNQRLKVNIADARPGKINFATGPALMTEMKPPPFVHQEDKVEDFNNERLLPWRMSGPGPCIAAGDVDGDGQDDAYIGNAAGAPGALLLQKNGAFQPVSAETWEGSKLYEDTGCVFFDADGDKDLDLAVASGGNSFPPNSPNYGVRIYLNDGKGHFSRKSSGMPPLTNSLYCVSAHDYDGDGDQDLFFGGWYLPGRYPVAPSCTIWQNDGGNFTNVSEKVGPAFKPIGMVRALTWADLDGDGKQELLAAGEWMSLKVFAVKNGQLEDVTAQWGLQGTEGFWRSLQAVDIDGDGDQDIIAGNLGLNTRYVASPEAPLRMYAKDFDENGSIDPIMTQMEGDFEYPVALREVMIKQLPGLRKKFVRSVTYAKSSIRDIYPEKELNSAQQLQCKYLASMVFIQENGKFTPHKLPNEAQIAPINAIQVFDWKNDGDPDLLIVGNDYGQQVESGWLDGGNGLLLENTGKGRLAPIHALRSGFWATRDARDVKMLRSGGGAPIFLVANNNSAAQAFK